MVGAAIDPEYLSVFLNSKLCRPQIDRAVTGSTRLALDYTAIRNLRILFPENLGEQQALARSVLDKLGEASKLHETAQALTAALPEMLGSAP